MLYTCLLISKLDKFRLESILETLLKWEQSAIMNLADCLWTCSSCSISFLVWGDQTGLAYSRISRIMMLWRFNFTCAGQNFKFLCRNALADRALEILLCMWVDHVKSFEIVMLRYLVEETCWITVLSMV